MQSRRLNPSQVERYLTPIAIAIGLLGILAMVLGPIRILIVNASQERLTGNDGAITSAQVSAGVIDDEMLASANSASSIFRNVVPFTTVLNRPRNKVETHTVGPGDTLFGLADRYLLTPDTIFWANPDTLRGNVHMIQSGVNLFILPVDGVYHRSYEDLTIQQIADKYFVEPEDIIDSPYNDLSGLLPADVPSWGMRLVVPGGTGEYFEISPLQTVTDSSGQTYSAFMPNMAGSCARGIAGYGGSGAWSPPISPGSYTFTQSYYPGHSGVDLAAVTGTPIVATDGGVVIYSGWVNADWGYGVLVVLDHGNGWTSYYAHMNATYVGCGQFVGRGATLGAVGSTGNSTGPHLHFEMRWNHNPDNPAAYVGF